MERKLATLKPITSLSEIPGADKIEIATIDHGWNVVVSKGKHRVGELVVYFEIDSWIPFDLAPFLFKSESDKKNYQGVIGMRLKTITLRGALSQGLVMALADLPEEILKKINPLESGLDLTELLGIRKYEVESFDFKVNPKRVGTRPEFIRKTDQERIQNLHKYMEAFKGREFEVTEKLDGTSMSVMVHKHKGESGETVIERIVCSRNQKLEESEEDTYWIMARKILPQLEAHGLYNLVLQGELCGNKIQGNRYALSGFGFFLFDVFDIQTESYYTPEKRREITNMIQVDHCPVISPAFLFEFGSICEVLEYANGPSTLNPKREREGVVLKMVAPLPGVPSSFKIISNNFLIEGDKKKDKEKKHAQ